MPSFADIADPVERLAVETSHPEWLVREWTDAYGFEAAEQICRIHMIPPKQTIRVNRLKHDRDTLLSRLNEAGIEAEEGDLSEDAVKLQKGTIASTPFSKKAKSPYKMKAQCW